MKEYSMCLRDVSEQRNAGKCAKEILCEPGCCNYIFDISR